MHMHTHPPTWPPTHQCSRKDIIVLVWHNRKSFSLNLSVSEKARRVGPETHSHNTNIHKETYTPVHTPKKKIYTHTLSHKHIHRHRHTSCTSSTGSTCSLNMPLYSSPRRRLVEYIYIFINSNTYMIYIFSQGTLRLLELSGSSNSCGIMQCVAVCCSVLQCVAVHLFLSGSSRIPRENIYVYKHVWRMRLVKILKRQLDIR